MKSLFISLVLALSTNAYALSEYGTLTGDDKKFTDLLISKLELTEEQAVEVYKDQLKAHSDTDDWQYNTFDNASITASKATNSPNKMLYFNFITSNRYVNISFFKLPEARQIFIHLTETLPREGKLALEKHNELKKDNSFEKVADKSKFSAFTKKQKTKNVKVLLNNGVGGIQYIDFYVYDLKD